MCDLTEPLDIGQPTVSHHLKVLTDAGFVTRSKRGTLGVLQARARRARLPLAPARHGVNLGLLRRLVAELLGSALLAALVIGSGIAAQRLSPDDVGLQLLENAFATALGLPVLILVFAPISGAHFNPVVSLVDSLSGLRSWRDTALYIPTQIIGCIVGAILANLMFGDPPSASARPSG